jgi:hypothetical protein
LREREPMPKIKTSPTTTPDRTAADRALAQQLAAENHRLHALNCPICQALGVNLSEMIALLRRYLDNHGANADAEGMSAICECRLCLDTRAWVKVATS